MRTGRQIQRQGTEERVLTAAAELFRAHGFAATTIRDIASAAGVSAGTVASVGDKNALLLASFDRLIGAIHRERAQDPAAPGSGVVEQIATLLDPFVDLFTADPALARTYASVLVAGENESSIFTDLADALTGEIEAVLLRAEAPEPRPAAAAIYFAYIGRLFTWPPGDDRDADALRSGLRDIVGAICPAAPTEDPADPAAPTNHSIAEDPRP